ncbi:MAG: DUF3592 domain-containing protein [Gemmatimonadetes bacterium]|nr:DUF3592 domain-containing protein [Gemmatimonadota bacterium]
MSSKSVVSQIGKLTWLLYLAGFGVAGYAGYVVQSKAERLSDWPQVRAKVLGRRVIAHESGYVGEVDFAYQETGLKYTSSGHDEVVSGSPGEALTRLAEWPVGSTRTIRYSPTDPAEVDMQATASVKRFVWPAIGILLGIVLVVLAVIQTVETYEEVKAHSVPPEPLPEGGPLPDIDWVARAQEAAEKRRQEAVAAKKVNAKVRKQVRRVAVAAMAAFVLGLGLAGASWLSARPQLVQRNEWRRTDATSVGVSVVDVERKGTTLYSVDALMALERSATGSALLLPAGGWYKERAKAEADSALVEYGSHHSVLLDPAEPFRGRLAITLQWTDFGWAIAFAVLALVAFAGGGLLVREALAVKAAGERKVKAAAPRTKMPTPPVTPTID